MGFLDPAGTPMMRLQGGVLGGPVGRRAAREGRWSGRRGNPGAKEHTSGHPAAMGSPEPGQQPSREEWEAERERRDFTGPRTPEGGGGGKVVINLVSPRSSQGRLEFWRPSRSQAEGEVRGGRELGKGTGRGGREAALSSHPLHGQGLHAGRGPGVLRHPHFCHSVLSHSLLCRSEIMLTVQFM